MRYQVKLITRLGIRYYDERIMAGIKLEATREEDEYRYDHKESLSGKAVFTDAASYALFYTLETALEIRDEPIYFVIYQWCNNSWVLKRTASIAMRDGEWDADKCTIAFKLIVQEKYKAWDDNKTAVINLFDGATARYTASHGTITGALPNGIWLYDALQYAFRQYYPTGDVRSEFLGFNPDDTSVVLSHPNYQTLLLFQNSDIVRRNISGYSPATGMPCSLDELVTNICKRFNLVYRIMPNGDLRIEPLSWFQALSSVALDLTFGDQEPYNRRLNRWAYQTGKIFRREVFKDTIEDPNLYLRGFQEIAYEHAGTESLPQDADKVVTSTFGWDVRYLASLDPDADTNEFKGITIVAATITTGTQTTIIEESTTTYGWHVFPNNVMSWPILLELFHLENRLFKTGILNFAPHTFLSTQRIRIQRGMKALICCTSWNPLNLVFSGLGAGEVSAYTYDFITGMVEMDLLFPVPDTNTIAIPDAEDDYYHLDMGTTYDTFAAGDPGLDANDSGVVSVLTETKNTFAGGTVVIAANGHFVYTPPDPGFYGPDSFQYTIIGASGYTDTATCYLAVRWPNVYVRPYTVTAQWFKDAAGTQPLNVTGFGIMLDYLDALTGLPNSVPATGYSQQLGYVYDAMTMTYSYDTVQPSADYTII